MLPRVLQNIKILKFKRHWTERSSLGFQEAVNKISKKSDNISLLILALELEVFAVTRTRLRNNFDEFFLFCQFYIFILKKIYTQMIGVNKINRNRHTLPPSTENGTCTLCTVGACNTSKQLHSQPFLSLQVTMVKWRRLRSPRYRPRRGAKSTRIWSQERSEVYKDMVPGEERSPQDIIYVLGERLGFRASRYWSLIVYFLP